MDKVSAKAAKEMYEHALKQESEYRHLISGKLIEFLFRLLLSNRNFSGNSSDWGQHCVHVHANQKRNRPRTG